MRTSRFLLFLVAAFLTAGTLLAQLSPKEQLGKFIFFDNTLSSPTGQSCASCHAPQVGFTGPSSIVNNTTVVYEGAVTGVFGNRKPPTAAYGGSSPVMYFDTKSHLFIGGMFWDGRATGWELGDPLSEQARGPFLNPREQNNPSAAAVVYKVQTSAYSGLFMTVYPGTNWSDITTTYNNIAGAISAYEKSSEVNPFTSKYDYYLKGMVKLSKDEQKGLSLFKGKGKCDKCHLSKQGPKGQPPMFTDFTYDNLGIPKNPQNPFYIEFPNWVDPGLGGFLQTVSQYSQYAAENYGKHKVPTLRNVDLRPDPAFIKAYGHNGFFKSLKDIVHFYNTRDVEEWPVPEVAANMNTAELGNLKLTDADEDAIVAFLKTLSDGYVIENSAYSRYMDEENDSKPVLMQNAPNPFNPTTIIRFELPEAGFVTLKVYNTLGQEVSVLLNRYESAGLKSVVFNAGSLPSGIYFYRLQSGNTILQNKMLLLK
jgi:cytochrome c peroxidase